MSNQNESRRAMRQFRANPILQWERIIAISVSSNPYPIDLKIKIMDALNQGTHDRLMEIAGELSAQVYTDHQTHYLMHQLAALISKYPNANLTGVSPEDAAIKVFAEAEARSEATNERILAGRRGMVGYASKDFDVYLHMMRRYIARVLGRVSLPDEDGPNADPDLALIMSRCMFTGGASLGVSGNATNLYQKLFQGLRDGWTCTPGALPYFVAALWENPIIREMILHKEGCDFVCYDKHEFVERVHRSVRLVDHNKIAFVPKNARIHRIVAAEPTANTFVLKGTDEVLRMALRKEGLDLTDQEPNKRMAQQGSSDWEGVDPYCTIDLTTASGMMAFRLVEETFPEGWFSIINAMRAAYYELPNGSHGQYQCFGSMGNGTVFPLQTLLFASICNAAYEELELPSDFRVYGDDIIVRKSVFARVVFMLREFGFEPNVKKTFGDGPFRESCGGDYHGGVNVRPVTLKYELSSLEAFFRFHNASLRENPLVHHYFRVVRRYLVKEVPKHLRFVTDYDPLVPMPLGLSTGERSTYESAFWGAQDQVMASNLCRYNRDTWSWGYTILSLESVSDGRVDENSISYSYGLLLTALRGGPSRKPFTLRYSTVYKPVRKNWPSQGDGSRKLKVGLDNPFAG